MYRNGRERTIKDMSTTDYLLNAVLIGLVVLQVRGRRLTLQALLLPLAVVGYVAITYLRSFPTAGNDLVLEIGCLTAGALLGLGCAFSSRLHRDSQGFTVVKAGAVAAGLWVVGIGSRLAFELFVTHGGADSIGRFSIAHDITPAAWVTALILMAFAEVAFRSGGIYLRAWRSGHLTAGRPAIATALGSPDRVSSVG
jgi:hypothetical protein